MTIPPRKIRNLPPALPAKETDVFPISQMGDDNVPVTRAMTRAQNNADMIAVITEARQEFVDTANQQHAELNARIDGKVDKPVSWSDLFGKPVSYNPAAHGHLIGDVTGLQSALDSAAATPVQSTWASLAGKPSTFTPAAHTHTYADISGKPNSFPPNQHSHAISDIPGLQAVLDAKTSAGNTLIGTAIIAENGLVLLALAVRRVNVAVAGVVTGGNYAIFPVNALPAGFGIVDAICTTNGIISFGMIVPVITGNYSIPVRVVKVNT